MKSPTIEMNITADEVYRSKYIKNIKRIPSHIQWWSFKLTLMVNDLIMMSAAFRFAYFLRFELNLPFFQMDVSPTPAFYFYINVLLLPFWLIIFAALGLYNQKYLLGGTEEYARVFRATLIGLLLVIIVSFLEPTLFIARGWLLMAWFFSFLFTNIGRFCLRRVVYFLRREGYFISPAVIVGANAEGLSLGLQLHAWKTSGLYVLGFVDKKLPPGTYINSNLKVLGSLEQLDDVINQYSVEELILASSAISSRDKMLDIFQRYGVSEGVNVRMSSGLYEIITTGLNVKEFAYVPLVGVNKVRLTGVDKVLKQILDYSLTIPLLILISPILLATAIAIKLDSPGPVLYRRRVMGVNGRQFDAFKFRTMRIDGDEIIARHPELKAELAENFKLKNDPRVTNVGRFLRKLSLDELPQLINVMKLDMSLVGPRMITPEEVEKYDRWGINLLTVRPGITGLWQVSGRSDISYNERTRLDMHYIRNWSIWFDFQLLLRTIPAVLRGRGAY
jgi:exopolysaccharide biosynthesis polyprenyl glycosylphosphotransferase